MIKKAKTKTAGWKTIKFWRCQNLFFHYSKIYPGLDLVGDNSDINIHLPISSNKNFLIQNLACVCLGASLLHNYNIIADFDEYNDLTQNIDVTQFYTLVSTILSQNAQTLSPLYFIFLKERVWL